MEKELERNFSIEKNLLNLYPLLHIIPYHILSYPILSIYFVLSCFILLQHSLLPDLVPLTLFLFRPHIEGRAVITTRYLLRRWLGRLMNELASEQLTECVDRCCPIASLAVYFYVCCLWLLLGKKSCMKLLCCRRDLFHRRPQWLREINRRREDSEEVWGEKNPSNRGVKFANRL